jgi:hypothetical protein
MLVTIVELLELGRRYEHSMARKKKSELRLYVTPSLERLLKTLSGLSDQTVSGIVEDTLRESLPDKYKDLMEAHNLEKLLEEEG